MKPLRVVSLFDGMSCGMIVLERAGIPIEVYYASEIDKHAQVVSAKNYPFIIRLGDVRHIDTELLKDIDLLIGGSPCQSFSFAGKRKGMATKDEVEVLNLEHYLELKEQNFEFEGQSYLFWEYMRILKAVQPKYFLLENVQMVDKWKTVLTRAIGINPIEINSNLVSAQNRERLYWTNIYAQPDGFFGDLKCMIPKPKDKGLLLKDILEPEVDEKYFLSEKMIDYLFARVANNHTTSDDKFELKSVPTEKNPKANFNGGKINFKTGEDVASCINGSSGHLDISDNKSACFTAGGNSGGLHSQMELIVRAAIRGRNPDNPTIRQAGLPTVQTLEERTDGKTNCLTCVQKDNVVVERKVKQINPSTESGGVQPYQQNRVYDIDGVSPALMAQSSIGSINIAIPEATKQGYVEIEPGECFDAENINSNTRMENKSNCLMAQGRTEFMQYTTDYHIRRLTPIECERLQTVPDNYTDGVSDTQRYRMLGNGWTVEVISHIFSFIGK